MTISGTLCHKLLELLLVFEKRVRFNVFKVLFSSQFFTLDCSGYPKNYILRELLLL